MNPAPLLIGLAALLLFLTPVRNARADVESFRITSIEVTPGGGISVRFPADTNAYYVLYQGGTLDTLDQPVSLVFGTNAEAQLTDPGAVADARFYRVRQVPVNDPLDLDRDGMDDVFEWRHRSILNPLDSFDAAQNPDSDARNNREEYGDGTDPETPDYALTVLVVDEPEPGNPNQFRELPDAVAALESRLGSEEMGRVVVATERALAVSSLVLQHHIAVEAQEGLEPKPTLVGPADIPLRISGPGTLGVTGFVLSAPAGAVISAGRHLHLAHNHLPEQTAVDLGIEPSPANPDRAGYVETGVMPGGSLSGATALVLGNQGMGLDLNLKGTVGAGQDQVLSMNNLQRLHVFAGARYEGSLKFEQNILDALQITFQLLASGQVTIEEHTHLDDLSVLANHTEGNPRLQWKNNLAGSIRVDVKGNSTLFLGFEYNEAKSVALNLGATRHVIRGRDEVFDNFTADLAALDESWLDLQFERLTLTALFRYSAALSEQAHVNANFGAFVNNGTTELTLGGSGVYAFGPGSFLEGAIKIRYQNPGDHTFSFDRVAIDGAMEVRNCYVNAGLRAFFTGGQVKNTMTYYVPEGATAMVYLEFGSGISFLERGGLIVIGETCRQQTGAPATARSVRPALAPAAESGIHLRGITWAGYADTNYILLRNVDVPVVVENCRIIPENMQDPDTPHLQLWNVAGPVTLRNNSRIDGGAWFYEVEKPVLIENNVIHGPVSLMYCPEAGIRDSRILKNSRGTTLDLWYCDRVMVERSVILNGEGPWAIVTMFGQTLLANNSITGYLGVGDYLTDSGVFGLVNNALANCEVIDGNPNGGLAHDPVPQGANPALVSSPVDFDGDGCADYPPPQRREIDGQCRRDGVPPPPSP